MKKQIGFMFLALTVTAALASTVSAANWRSGNKVGDCTAHVYTSGNTCEVSFRGEFCKMAPINGTPASGNNAVCVTANGSFTEGDDPWVVGKDELPKDKTK